MIACNTLAMATELDIHQAAAENEHAVRHHIIPRVFVLVDVMRGKEFVSLVASLYSSLIHTYRVANAMDFEYRFFDFATSAARMAEKVSFPSGDDGSSSKPAQNKNAPNDKKSNFTSNNNYRRDSNNSGNKNFNNSYNRKDRDQQRTSWEHFPAKQQTNIQEIVKFAKDEDNAKSLRSILCPYGSACKRHKASQDCWFDHGHNPVGKFKISNNSTYEKFKSWLGKKSSGKGGGKASKDSKDAKQ